MHELIEGDVFFRLGVMYIVRDIRNGIIRYTYATSVFTEGYEAGINSQEWVVLVGNCLGINRNMMTQNVLEFEDFLKWCRNEYQKIIP